MRAALLSLCLLAAACAAPRRVEATLRGGALELDGHVGVSSGPVSGETSDAGLGREFVPEGRLELLWDRAHVRLNGIGASYEDDVVVTADLDLGGGREISRGSTVKTEFDFVLLTTGVSYDLLVTDLVSVGVGLEGGAFRYEIALQEKGGGERVEWSSWIPLAYPVLDLSSRLGPVSLFAEGGAISLSIDDLRYTFGQLDVGGGFRLFGEGERVEGFLSVGYRYFFFEHERDHHRGGLEIDAALAGPYLGFTLAF